MTPILSKPIAWSALDYNEALNTSGSNSTKTMLLSAVARRIHEQEFSRQLSTGKECRARLTPFATRLAPKRKRRRTMVDEAEDISGQLTTLLADEARDELQHYLRNMRSKLSLSASMMSLMKDSVMAQLMMTLFGLQGHGDEECYQFPSPFSVIPNPYGETA